MRPTLAASDGDLWLMSTSNGKRGFFREEWAHAGDRWQRIGWTAENCERVKKRGSRSMQLIRIMTLASFERASGREKGVGRQCKWQTANGKSVSGAVVVPDSKGRYLSRERGSGIGFESRFLSMRLERSLRWSTCAS